MITLRAPEPQDLDLMYQLENDPEQWMATGCSMFYSRYALRQYIEQCQNHIQKEGQLRLTVCLDSEPIGFVDLFDYDATNRRAAVGIGIAPAYRGQGWGRQALESLVQYAFCSLHLHQLYAHVCVINNVSISLFDGVGFQRAGLLRQWIIRPDEAYEDAILFQKIKI